MNSLTGSGLPERETETTPLSLSLSLCLKEHYFLKVYNLAKENAKIKRQVN